MSNDWFKINRKQITEWLSQKLDKAKDEAISLDDKAVVERTQAIIEARLYKKLISEMENICENKKKIEDDHI